MSEKACCGNCALLDKTEAGHRYYAGIAVGRCKRPSAEKYHPLIFSEKDWCDQHTREK